MWSQPVRILWTFMEMHGAHQPRPHRNVADHGEVALLGAVASPARRAATARLGGQLARNARTGAVQNPSAPRGSAARGERSRPKRWPGGGVARGVHPDLGVRRTAPDATGDHPPWKPRVGGAGGVGREHRGGRGRHVRYRRGEALFGDWDDQRLRAETAAAAALATGGPVVAWLGVARFVQVAVLRSRLWEGARSFGRRPGSRCRRRRWRWFGSRRESPTAWPRDL